jgi:signal transduction histidine kinase
MTNNERRMRSGEGAKSMKILIVDDKEEDIYLLEAMLKGIGHEVESARNGVEALKKLKKDSINMIITDILMPKMDGFQFCMECKHDMVLKKIPFVFYTATYIDKEDEEFALSLGAEKFVVKPTEPDAFLKILEGVFEEQKRGELIAAKMPIMDETVYLKEYNEELVKKLEKKMQNLNEVCKKLKESEQKYKKLVKERTRELEKTQEELIRKERMAVLGQLTATIGHEIRNPLSTVRNAVFSIGDAIGKNEMDRIYKSLKLADRNIDRCDRIIEELMDFTRSHEMKLEPLDIDCWLDNVLDEQKFPEGIECVRELNSGITLPVDHENMRRAVGNIINNAVQALQDENSKGNRLTVKTVKTGGRLEMRFIDSGPGIPDELFGKIFEPLFSTRGFGIGLGIPIVKKIMEECKGGVEYQSEAGKGTTVTLWLPVQSK